LRCVLLTSASRGQPRSATLHASSLCYYRSVRRSADENEYVRITRFNCVYIFPAELISMHDPSQCRQSQRGSGVLRIIAFSNCRIFASAVERLCGPEDAAISYVYNAIYAADIRRCSRTVYILPPPLPLPMLVLLLMGGYNERRMHR